MAHVVIYLSPVSLCFKIVKSQDSTMMKNYDGLSDLSKKKKSGNMPNKATKSKPENSSQLVHSDFHTRNDILAIL